MSIADKSGKDLAQLWEDRTGARADWQKRFEYYQGKHAIVGEYKEYADGTPKSQRVANWPRYIVDLYTGLLTSQPYQITKDSDDATGIDTYAEISRINNLPAIDVTNLRNALVFGQSVELHSFVDGGAYITAHDPREWVILRDDSDDVYAAIRIAKIPKGTVLDDEPIPLDKRIMTVYTDSIIATFEESQNIQGGAKVWEETGRISHSYGQVPIVVWGVSEGRDTLLTDALLGQCDEYNEIDSASGDDVRNQSDALLVLKGLDPSWVKEHSAMIKDLRVLPLPEGAEAMYLAKSTDVVRIESRLKRTRQHIHMMGGVPDIEEITGATGSTSGIALKLKFMPMVENAESYSNHILAGLHKRIELINAIHGKTSTLEIIDGYNVKINITLPVNRIEEWQNIAAVNGIVSHRTQLEWLTDVEDPERELDALEQEAANASQNEQKSPEQLAAENDMIVQAAAADIAPKIDAAIQAVSDGALDALLQSGAIDRIVKARKSEQPLQKETE